MTQNFLRKEPVFLGSGIELPHNKCFLLLLTFQTMSRWQCHRLAFESVCAVEYLIKLHNDDGVMLGHNCANSFVVIVKHCFFKWANPACFSFIFGLFQTNIITIFTTNKCEKMSTQYTAPGFKPTTSRTRVVYHNH